MTEVAEATAPARPASTASRELSVIHQGNASVPMPTNFDQMKEFAKLMAQGTNMVGPAFRENPGACLGALIQAMRWGMDPYSCSQKMYIASKTGEGPIAYEAQLVHAVILKNAPLTKRPRCTYSGEGQELRCHVVFHVIGEDEPLTYDSPPLKKVKKNSPLWVDDPEQQLWYYSVRAGARRHFPDVIMGVYTPDEVEQVGKTQVIEGGEVFTLGGQKTDTDNIPDAEFSDGTAVLAKNAEKAKKKAARKDGPKDNSEEKSAPQVTTAPEGGRSAESAAPAADATANASSDTPNASQPNEPDDDVESDEELVVRVENEVKAAKPNEKSQPIRDAKGALQRIVETTDNPKLKARADSLLNRYEL